MKKRLRHRGRVIAILLAFAVAIGPTSFAMAAGGAKRDYLLDEVS